MEERILKKRQLRTFVTGLVLIFCLLCFSSCGYFLYPERRGQTQGEIDIPILILDSSGLLLGIVPGISVLAVVGVVALAVDFTSGSIYLTQDGKTSELEIIQFDNSKPLKKAYLESILSQHIGKEIRIDRNSTFLFKVDAKEKKEIKELLDHLNDHIDEYATLNAFAYANR